MKLVNFLRPFWFIWPNRNEVELDIVVKSPLGYVHWDLAMLHYYLLRYL